MRRLTILLLVCGLMGAQQGQQAQPEDQPRFIVPVTNVIAPTLVTDRSGAIINGLQPNTLRIFDNGKEQNIHNVDLTFVPMSIVVAIQGNSKVEKLLPSVNRVGILLKPILLGDQGEAAVIAYDSRVRVMQDFTSDADAITASIKKINAGSAPNRLTDAVEEATRLLSTRNKDRRRILLVIGETRDSGSSARLRETVINLQIANITT